MMASGEKRSAYLAAIREASAALTSDLDLHKVLQTVVDGSRVLVNARYAALGVLNEQGTEIEQFITAGIPAELRAHIGPFPRGHGLLGVIIQEGRTVRVDDISADARSSPGPHHHPTMHTFLGVPIVSKGRVLGNLYLTDKRPDDVGGADATDSEADEGSAHYPPFTEDDAEILELFAMQAAIAIENAILHRQREQLAIARERERFAMDLHDGIIQSIYAVGLTLDDGRYQLDNNPPLARERIDRAIIELDTVIADLRAYIMNLEPSRFHDRDLQTGLEEQARELRASSFLRIDLKVDPRAAAEATPEQTRELLHIAKEALSNAHRHAHGSSIQITVEEVEREIVLAIEDDGMGLPVADGASEAGNGLANMQERAHRLGGTMVVDSRRGHGVRLRFSVPLA